MTPKQEAFVREYLVDLNATQAAIRCGHKFASLPKAGFYVYLLADPTTGMIFYVGKGAGQRVRQHAKDVKRGKVDNAPKFQAIQKILDAGHEVQELIFCAAKSEAEAYAIERNLIVALREHGLANIVAGVVTNQEAVSIRAKHLLSRVKAFDVWVSELTESQRKECEAIWGSCRAFHDKIQSYLVRAACA